MFKFLIAALVSLPILSRGQERALSSGATVTGSNGEVSYSIGLIDYVQGTGAGGSVSLGLQQPLEIFAVGISDQKIVRLEMKAYPNPVHSLLNLQIQNKEAAPYRYVMKSIDGKIIKDAVIYAEVTEISFDEWDAGIYLIEVFNQSESIQLFKIIKH
jgi:hypothetical protein